MSVRNELVRVGIIDARSELATQKINGYVVMGAFLGTFIAMFFEQRFGIIIFIGSFTTLIIAMIFYYLIRRLSGVGADFRNKIFGYNDFLTKVLKDRAPYYEKNEYIDDHSAFAVLFGVSKGWDKLFAPLLFDEKNSVSSAVPKKARSSGMNIIYDEFYPTVKSTLLIAESVIINKKL